MTSTYLTPPDDETGAALIPTPDADAASEQPLPVTVFPPDAVERHLLRHLGKIDFVISGNAEGETPQPDLLVSLATKERPFHVVVTRGVSAKPMAAPKEEWQLAELCILLPPEWHLAAETLPGDPGQWPLRWLLRLSAIAVSGEGWLGYGHTVPNGEPPAPFAEDTRLTSWLLLPSVSLPPNFARLRLKDERILNFWALVGIHRDETLLKVNHGTPALMEKLSLKNVSDILAPGRKSIYEWGGVTLKRWLFPW